MCLRYARPVACGAYTPTEALTAHEAGADFIKLFPADGLGPKYIQNLLAPLPMLRIIPGGGVTVDTAGDFLRCRLRGIGGRTKASSARSSSRTKIGPDSTARVKAFVEVVAVARAGRVTVASRFPGWIGSSFLRRIEGGVAYINAECASPRGSALWKPRRYWATASDPSRHQAP